jgi:hypothetical protein
MKLKVKIKGSIKSKDIIRIKKIIEWILINVPIIIIFTQ